MRLFVLVVGILAACLFNCELEAAQRTKHKHVHRHRHSAMYASMNGRTYSSMRTRTSCPSGGCPRR